MLCLYTDRDIPTTSTLILKRPKSYTYYTHTRPIISNNFIKNA